MSIKFNFLSLVLGGFSKAAAKLQKNSDSRNSLYLFFAKIQANKYKLHLLNMVKKKVDSPNSLYFFSKNSSK